MPGSRFERWFADVAARLGLRPAGYRRVAGTVAKRVARRQLELGLADLDAYDRWLAAHPDEQRWLDAACRITISRCWRDAAVFDALAERYLPERAAAAQAAGRSVLRAWSAGSASGEEAYSVSIAWQLLLAARHPGLSLEVLGTDADPRVLARARLGRYAPGTLRELPLALRSSAFAADGDGWVLRERFRAGVRFEQADLRAGGPSGPFDLILCRNLAFSYFDTARQLQALRLFAQLSPPGALLVVGAGEALPEGFPAFVPLAPCIHGRREDAYQRRP